MNVCARPRRFLPPLPPSKKEIYDVSWPREDEESALLINVAVFIKTHIHVIHPWLLLFAIDSKTFPLFLRRAEYASIGCAPLVPSFALIVDCNARVPLNFQRCGNVEKCF